MFVNNEGDFDTKGEITDEKGYITGDFKKTFHLILKSFNLHSFEKKKSYKMDKSFLNTSTTSGMNRSFSLQGTPKSKNIRKSIFPNARKK